MAHIIYLKYQYMHHHKKGVPLGLKPNYRGKKGKWGKGGPAQQKKNP